MISSRTTSFILSFALLSQFSVGEGNPNFVSQIEVRGDVKVEGVYIYSRNLTLGKLLELAAIKKDWSYREVRVLRDGQLWCLRPYPSPVCREERVYPGNIVEVRRRELWDWFKLQALDKNYFLHRAVAVKELFFCRSVLWGFLSCFFAKEFVGDEGPAHTAVPITDLFRCYASSLFDDLFDGAVSDLILC